MSSGRQGINTAGAPAPQPFYNQAVVANGLVFCSGQVPKDLSGKFVEGPIQARANQCIKNLKAVLEAAGSDLGQILEVNVFLTRSEDLNSMNEAYLEWFKDIKPARTCVIVKDLPGGTDVEMKCIARVTSAKL